MSELTKSEALSFYNANAVPLPENQPALYDVYVTPEGELKLVNHQAEVSLGSIAPIVPVSVDEAVLVDGRLSLVMTDGTIVPIGDIDRPDVYLLPELNGTGLRQSAGNFEPMTSAVPEVTITEETEAFRISAVGLNGARTTKRIECAIRRDYTGGGGGSIAENAGSVLNRWFALPALNFLDDPDEVGASLVNGKLVLPPGIYYVDWKHTSYRTNVTASRLWSLTHANEILRGQSMYYTNNGDCSCIAVHNSGYFKLTETTTIEIQMRIGNTTSQAVLWSAYNTIMGFVKDLLHLEIFKYPDGIGDIPEVKRVVEVTRRVTSAVNGNLTISANSQTAGFEAWKCLDSDTLSDTTKWASLSGVAPSAAAPHWIAYSFSDGPKRVTRYGIWAPNTASSIYNPKSWEFQGRNADEESWTTLDGVSGWTLNAAGSACVRDLPAPVEYSQYRLLITERNSGTTNGVQIGEFRLFNEY